ncbi:TauD-domain-containing protein [Coleophoma crateriformis]|uniref:TauD-domain-containing protein n=1 Tax=Coleophoma crateriformis TaxID=565419 RepID=A0A3D8SB56_9HELO|nr:TauD-domain-containing protein [Coleophoma crateriformis]
MSTNTTIETVLNSIENLSLPVEKQEFTKVPGGYEVSYKGSKWFTGTKPNHDFIPPKDFRFPGNTTAVPINPKGPTEMPQTLTADYTDYRFKHFLAHTTLTKEHPLEEYDHIDCAFRADPEKKALFAAISSKKDLTPSIGTEVHGVQLSLLSDTQKDELALWAAERGVLVFRDQDFVYQSPEFLKEYGSHFGRLHVHSFGSHVKEHPEILSNLRDSNNTVFDNYSAGMLTTTRWHSDMTYEKNPMGTTFLCALEVPETGGDTLYLNSMDAYDKLSDPMKAFLEGLDALHSGQRQAVHGIKTSVYRRDLVDTVHPIIRKHPVTGRKALWFPPEYITGIVGLKNEESNAITAMLYSHLQSSLDFHTRVKWEKDTVVVYDNRMVMHSVVLDYPLGVNEKRHHIRITPQAEKPIPARSG